MSAEKKDVSTKKSSISLIPDDIRKSIVYQFEKMGISASEMSDEELLREQTKLLKEESEKRISSEASVTTNTLNGFMAGEKLKDKKFIERLYNLGVLKIFLPIFEEEDVKLEDKEIWEKIGKSSIRQIKDTAEIYKKRTVTVNPNAIIVG